MLKKKNDEKKKTQDGFAHCPSIEYVMKYDTKQ